MLKKCAVYSEKIIEEDCVDYELAGFPGCVGGEDTTHVGLQKSYCKLRQYHNSYRLNMPSRTDNITVTHKRRILLTISGHLRRWNDKTLILYDSFATIMKTEKWTIVDNRNLQCSTIPQ